MSWWIWILIAFLLLIAEFFVTTMHVGFFAAGAFLVAALVAMGYGGTLTVQLLIFSGFSLFALLVLRPQVMKRLTVANGPEVDSMVGEQAITMTELAAGSIGRVELRGSTWNARNVGENTLAAGVRCTVVQIEGLMFHVRA